MKKLTALFVTLLICATSLLSLVVYAADDVTFEGDFNSLSIVVGQGKTEDLFKGITAKDTATGADLTDQIKYAGEVDFETEGEYKIIYLVSGKTTFKERVIRIVKSSTTGNLIHREPDHGSNFFQETDFISVIGTDRKLVYELYTDNTYKTIKYSWIIKGKDLKEGNIKKFNINIFNTCANAERIKNAVGKVNYKIISFDCGEVDFPAPAEIMLYVGDVFKNEETLYLYKYTDNNLKLVADSIEVNAIGYIPSITLSKGGDYVLTDKKAGYQEPVSSQETSSKETSSKETSSKETSSKPVSSQVTSSEIVSSEETSSEIVSSEVTSSEPTNSNSPDVSTILLVVMLSAFGLMVITVIAFAIVRKNA